MFSSIYNNNNNIYDLCLTTYVQVMLEKFKMKTIIIYNIVKLHQCVPCARFYQ